LDREPERLQEELRLPLPEDARVAFLKAISVAHEPHACRG